MRQKPKGTLIIIGGHEDKDGDSAILKEVAARANEGRNCLVITTVASQLPEEMIEEYTQVFKVKLHVLGADDTYDLATKVSYKRSES